MAAIQELQDLPSTIDEDLLDYAAQRGFGEIHMKIDPATGLRAIVAIHSTKLGPALGGCRCIEYDSTDAALFDVMRLARAMSFKAALVGLEQGGGKTVLLKPKKIEDREAYFRAFGKFLNELNGRYITAVDSGTSVDDMDVIGQESSYVASLSSMDGEPSPFTATGVRRGIEAAVKSRLGKDSVEGLHISIQGVGHVGYLLAKELHERGARLTVTDINQTAVERCVQEFNAASVSGADIYKIDCDVFAPSALGAIINDTTIEQLSCPIVAGSANNQLARAYHGEILHKKEILYAPDYVINAGGLILASNLYNGVAFEEIPAKVDHIYDSLMEIFKRSQQEDRPTSDIADTMAMEKLS